MRSSFRSTIVLSITAVLAVAGCSGSGSTTPPAAPIDDQSLNGPDVFPLPSPSTIGDDWATYAHDDQRTAYQPQNTGITRQNVQNLKLRWTYNVPSGEVASPIVSGGSIYLAGLNGTVHSLAVSDGHVQWQQSIGFGIRMTPALRDGMLFVGAYNGAPNFFALNAKSGATVWQASLPGWIRGEPVIHNGVVYEGSSGGDIPFCYQGGLFALNESTGTQEWQWLVNPFANDGGSVWAPISFDGQHLIFGTGNTCAKIINTGDSVISLTLNGKLNWQWDQTGWDSRVDDDMGGGALLVGSNLFIANKNAYFYSINPQTGSVLWKQSLGGAGGYGSIGTPSTDGKVIMISIGQATSSSTAPGGGIVALNPTGQRIWSISTQQPNNGYVAVTHGIAFATLDNKLVALDPATGKTLWSYTAPADFYASPVIVPSGVYAVDQAGHAFAFSLGQ
ncbi:MAG: outer membrane protein assembly factor BamB family protein [Vulcanimicrobiaceae bacterium]